MSDETRPGIGGKLWPSAAGLALFILLAVANYVIKELALIDAENLIPSVILVLVLVFVSGAVGAIVALFYRLPEKWEFLYRRFQRTRKALEETQVEAIDRLEGALQLSERNLHFLESLKRDALADEDFGQISESIISYSNLEALEASVPGGSEILIFTTELDLESSYKGFDQIVIGNLKRGVTYRYIIPDNELMEGRLRKLAHSWCKQAGLEMEQARALIQCSRSPLPSRMIYMTLAVYNSADPYLKDSVVVIKFPTNEIFSEKEFPFIFRVKDTIDAKRRFAEDLEALASSSVDVEVFPGE